MGLWLLGRGILWVNLAPKFDPGEPPSELEEVGHSRIQGFTVQWVTGCLDESENQIHRACTCICGREKGPGDKPTLNPFWALKP